MAMALTRWRNFISMMINEIDEDIEKNNHADIQTRIKMVIAKLMVYLPDIKNMNNINGNSYKTNPHEADKQNLLELKAVLESINDTPLEPNVQSGTNLGQSSTPISVNIDNQNNNNQDAILNNTNEIVIGIDIKVEFQKLKDQISNNGYISEDERADIINQIEELESINESDETRFQKWSKMKGLMNWMGTKGVDVAIQFMPLMMKMLENPAL